MANIVTVKELGEFLKLSDSTIYNLALDGELPGFKIGDSWRFDMDEILKRIKEAKSAFKGPKQGLILHYLSSVVPQSGTKDGCPMRFS